jgi:hypothetical protein
MKTTHITENAVRNHAELFQHLESKLSKDRSGVRYGSAQVAKLTPIYDQTPAHSFL